MNFNSIVAKSHRFRSGIVTIATVFFVLSLNACTVKLVQPFDEKLINDTEAFYKKGAEMIIEGQDASPKTDKDRDSIADPDQNPAHFSNFESKYDALIVDSETLILRAMSNSQAINSAGQAIQEKIEELIGAAVPTNCPDLQSEFGKVSLTAQNFVDLKCLILRWKEQHREKGIFKNANWEGRKRTLFNIVFAIQKAESFKKEKEKK
jgi:hypothetical protein